MALFTDVVQGPGFTTAAAAAAVSLPNLTLPSSARMITRIWVTACITNHNVAEPLVGYVRVTSDDCGIAPFQIPLEPVPGFITVAQSVQREAHKWIVNCPCPGGAILKFDVVGDVAQTAAPEVQVTVEFSFGGSPFPGPQLHMTCGAAPATLGTADNVDIALNDITITAAHLLMVFGYALQLQPTADEACPTTVSVTSSDFLENGPFKFAWNPHGAGIANCSSGGVDLTTIETDRAFKTPNQKQTLSCVTTTRDAMAGNGRANWGVVYS
jgi:hypothetical protein